MAEEVGWSRRRLEMRFRNQIGLSPKKVARILRFHRAAEVLATDGARGLSDLAIEFGFWDQAHLNLEFRTMCGHTPVGSLNALRSAHYPQRSE